MNIVIVSTARSMRPSSLATFCDELGVSDSDHVGLILAHRPYRPLPVDVALQTGSDVAARRHAISLPVAPRQAGSVSRDVVESPGGAPDADLEPEPDLESAVSPQRPAATLPGRIRHGLGWRARRVRFAVRDHPVVSRVRHSTKVRKAKNAVVPGRPSAWFALNTIRAAEVGDLVGAADVVVALDSNTHRAAWLLARQHRAPVVVVGVPAGRRVIAEQRKT